jgi:hypothetical protein
MTPNPNRNPVPLPFTADWQPPVTPWPALSQNRDPRLNKPDEAEAAATVSGWPRVFPGL